MMALRTQAGGRAGREHEHRNWGVFQRTWREYHGRGRDKIDNDFGWRCMSVRVKNCNAGTHSCLPQMCAARHLYLRPRRIYSSASASLRLLTVTHAKPTRQMAQRDNFSFLKECGVKCSPRTLPMRFMWPHSRPTDGSPSPPRVKGTRAALLFRSEPCGSDTPHSCKNKTFGGLQIPQNPRGLLSRGRR